MLIFGYHPETWVGWALLGLCAIVMIHALVIIVNDARRRRPNGWDLAAVAFVVLTGPFGAALFIAVHEVMTRRQRRAEAGG